MDPKAAPGGRLCLLEPEIFGSALQFKVIEGKNLKIQTSIEFVQIFSYNIALDYIYLHHWKDFTKVFLKFLFV